MKVLAVLWTVCLVGVCGAGFSDLFSNCLGRSKTDDKVTDTAVQGDSNANGPHKDILQNTNAQVTTKSSTSITLDLANPDLKIKKTTRNNQEVEHTTYDPEEYSNVTSIVDGKFSIWDGNKLIFAKVSKKGGSSVLLVYAGTGSKYFDKVGNEWKEISKDDYDKKLQELSPATPPKAQESSSPPSNTSGSQNSQ